jgi:ParB family chromosome partitioning protein
MLNQLHRIKILDSFADAVYSGDKTFEVRKNDRGYQKGDYVDFIVLYADGCEYVDHPLSKKRYEITYVLSGWGIEDGYCVFGIKQVT